MLDITDQDSNYSSSSNSSLYKRIYDEKTPINQSVTYHAPNDNSGNQNTKDNINSIDEKAQKEDSTAQNSIKINEITKEETYEQMPQPRIVNIVSSFDLGCDLNLREIALKCANSEYNPQRFNALIMRKKNPKTSALIFRTGKIICTGAQDEETSKKAGKLYARDIKKNLEINVKFKNFKIINIASACDVKFHVKLNLLNAKLAYKLSKKNLEQHICYEPENFPGLIYHMINPKLCLTIFNTGKINFVGAKNRDDIYKALKNIYPLVKKYKNEIVTDEFNMLTNTSNSIE
jgi:transcription initiation factor TFIID TATA-box-binding protein